MLKIIVFVATRFFWAVAWIYKNFGLLVGLAEQILKVLAGIADLTATRADDRAVEWIDRKFGEWQGKIYRLAETITQFYEAWGRSLLAG